MHANGVPFLSPGSSLRDPGNSWFGNRALKGRNNAHLLRPFRARGLLSLSPRVSQTRPWANEFGAVGAASLHASWLNGYRRAAPSLRCASDVLAFECIGLFLEFVIWNLEFIWDLGFRDLEFSAVAGRLLPWFFRKYPRENFLGRTKAGEGRLDEVESDKHGEQQPPSAEKMREDDADQDHCAGEYADAVFEFHRRRRKNFVFLFSHIVK